MNFYKLEQILRGRKHRTWAYLPRRHTIKSRLQSKFSVQHLILGYVLPCSFNIITSSSRYTGHWMSRIGREQAAVNIWPHYSSPLRLLRDPLPFTNFSQSKQDKWRLQGQSCVAQLLPNWAQSWADPLGTPSQGKQQNRLASKLVWIFHYIAVTLTARGTLCNRLLSLERALWKDESQEPTSSSLRVVSGEKERKQDIIGPLVCCHCLLI